MFMETIYFKGVECHTMGAFPRVGNKAYCFSLTTSLFKEVELGDYKGECVVLNIFPSLDTDVCAMSVRKFNEMASLLDDVVVICVSMDLPFAAQRFCVAEGIDDVIVASAFRSATFGQKYGVQIVDGLLSGLLARASALCDFLLP